MAEHPRGGMRSLSAMAGAFNKLFGDFVNDAHRMAEHAGHVWEPPTDVFECDKVFVIKMALSGLTKYEGGELKDAEVLIENDTIIIRGRRTDRCPHTKRNFYQMEIHYGYFERRVCIRAPFDREHVHAEYRDGFLEVVVPKAERIRPGTHRIEVHC